MALINWPIPTHRPPLTKENDSALLTCKTPYEHNALGLEKDQDFRSLSSVGARKSPTRTAAA